jgi:hypothetical protein
MAPPTALENGVHWVALPEGAGAPVVAYVNGEPRTEGVVVRDGRVWFDPPLRCRPPLGLGRKMMLAFGVGVYGDLRGDSLDMQVQRGGHTELIGDITLRPTPRDSD